jgi:hypothetical protein
MTLRRGAIRLEKRLCSAADRVRPPPPGLTALLYHRTGRRSSLEVDISTPLFRDQIEWLRSSGRVVDVREAVEFAVVGRSGDDTPTRPVVLTFDDGTSDFIDEAFPLLVANGLPVVLFVATQFIEEGKPFPHDGAPTSWQALSDAMTTGLLVVGSHGHTHRSFRGLGAQAASEELRRSCGLIADHLGVRPTHFAYPNADHPSPEAEAVVRGTFDSAWLASMRVNPLGRSVRHRLWRSWLHEADGMRWFIEKVDGGLRLEGHLRRLRTASANRPASRTP